MGKCLLCKLEDLSSDPHHFCNKLHVAEHICHPTAGVGENRTITEGQWSVTLVEPMSFSLSLKRGLVSEDKGREQLRKDIQGHPPSSIYVHA